MIELPRSFLDPKAKVAMAKILGHLDELVHADRVVVVSVHQGKGLVAFLNSAHLLPDQFAGFVQQHGIIPL